MQEYYILYIDNIGVIDYLHCGSLEMANDWMEFMDNKKYTAVKFNWGSSVLFAMSTLVMLHNERQ